MTSSQTTNLKPQDQSQQRLAFWERGAQYYVAGALAVGHNLNPVAGNLLHHAIEHMLKGALSKTHTLRELKGHLHGLSGLWNEFKGSTGVASLAKFDGTVAALNRYEDLRYPDDALANGMSSFITSHRLPIPREMQQRVAALPQVKKYELCLQDIRELAEAIFAAAKMNPLYFFDRLGTKACLVVAENNPATTLLIDNGRNRAKGHPSGEAPPA